MTDDTDRPMGTSAPHDVALERALADLAIHYRRADGVSLRLVSALGAHVGDITRRLPDPARTALEEATAQALRLSLRAADSTRSLVPDRAGWTNTAAATAMGAAGGAAGLAGALVELPVTTTMLLRSIQGVAAEHGFDPASDSVRFDTLDVFGAGGPIRRSDQPDLSFITLRMSLSGPTMNALIAGVAPKLAAVLGQKLAAQAVPVLGAVTGAATNYAFANYYRQIAHVRFGLRALAIESGLSEAELTAQLAAILSRAKVPESMATGATP